MSYLVLPPSVEKVQEVRIQLQVDRLGNSWDWGLDTHLRMRRMMGSRGGAAQEGFTGVATQMMDAADQRMPTLSVNARRKSFHALAVIMFIPGIAVDVSPLLFPFFCNLWNDDTRAKTRLVDIAGIHSSILLCRICRIQLCRIRPLFCPLAVWRQGSSLFERIPGSQGFWDSNLESFLFIGGVCCASMV